MIEVILALLLAQSKQIPPPEQPIPFSHKQHAGALKLKCKMCHPNAGSGETMQIATASTCMQCHSAIQTDSPAIQKMAAFAKDNREIPWARVYEIPSYVNFSHKTHLDAAITCENCHGRVAERESAGNARAETAARAAAVEAVLARLDEIEQAADGQKPAAAALRRLHAERRAKFLADLDPNVTREADVAALRLDLIGLERASIAEAYEKNRITDESRRQLEREFDLEEASLRHATGE